MTDANKKIFKNRLKSFLWRLGAYIVVGTLAFVSDNLGLFDLPAFATTIVALIIGEITKYLNVDLRKPKELENN